MSTCFISLEQRIYVLGTDIVPVPDRHPAIEHIETTNRYVIHH